MEDLNSKLASILENPVFQQLPELKAALFEFGLTLDQAAIAMSQTESPDQASEFLLKYCSGGHSASFSDSSDFFSDMSNSSKLENEGDGDMNRSTMLAEISQRTSKYARVARAGINYVVPSAGLISSGLSTVSQGIDYYSNTQFAFGLAREWGPRECRALSRPLTNENIRVVVVRHAKAQGDDLDSSSFFHRDPVLSAIGLDEATKLSEKLNTNTDFLKRQKLLIVISPFKRCLLTAINIMGGYKWEIPTKISPLCAEHTNYASHIQQANRGSSVLDLNKLFQPELCTQFKNFQDLTEYSKEKKCESWWHHSPDAMYQTDEQFNQRAIEFKRDLLEQCMQYHFENVLIISHQSFIDKAFMTTPSMKNCEFRSFDLNKETGELVRCEDTLLPAKELIVTDVEVDPGYSQGYFMAAVSLYNPFIRLAGSVHNARFDFRVTLTEIRTSLHVPLQDHTIMLRQDYESYFPVKFPSSGMTSHHLMPWLQYLAISLENEPLVHKKELKEKFFSFFNSRCLAGVLEVI
jgi:broad specificity phosphatase PhoE